VIKLSNPLATSALIATLLAFVVIGLGAYTRITNSGLGCPDWPGCYGQVVVPKSSSDISKTNPLYAATPLVKRKAWIEMLHRYSVALLGLAILLVTIFSVKAAVRKDFSTITLTILLLGMLAYQILLGMWTVTYMLLPLIVSLHLIGGMLTLSLLWLIYLKSKKIDIITQSSSTLKYWAVLGLMLVFAQIALGAWTSSNYAALSCPDFPYCNAHWQQYFDVRNAFKLFTPIGINYEGGVLSTAAKMTVHMTHRFGALVVALYLFLFSFITLAKVKNNRLMRNGIYATLFLLLLQLCLGLLIVLFNFPLSAALLHNVIAAVLLQAVIFVNFVVYAKPNLIETST